MATELLLTPPAQAADLIRGEFRKQDVVIAEIREKYTGLTVAKDGFKTVKAARIEVKNLRCNVETLRKDLKADVLDRGKLIDEEANRLKGLLIPIEKVLADEEEAEEERKAAEARAKVEAAERRLQSRINRLSFAGIVPDIVAIKDMTDEAFELYFTEQDAAMEAKRAAEIEARRIQKEKDDAEAAARAKLEAERKAEQERQAAEIQKQREELAAAKERLRVQAEEIERQRLADQQSAEAERLRLKAIADKAAAEERAKLDAERAELRKQQEASRLAEEARQAEADRLAAIHRKRIMDEEEAERVRQLCLEQEKMRLAEEARILALRPVIEKAEELAAKIQRDIETFLTEHAEQPWTARVSQCAVDCCAEILMIIQEG